MVVFFAPVFAAAVFFDVVVFLVVVLAAVFFSSVAAFFSARLASASAFSSGVFANPIDEKLNASTNANNRTYHWQRIWREAIEEGLDFPEIAGINNSTNIMRLKINSGNNILYPAFDPNNISLLEWNPYYKLSLSQGGSSLVARGINYLNASLIIYPDGNTYSSEARTYSTALLFTGGLP